MPFHLSSCHFLGKLKFTNACTAFFVYPLIKIIFLVNNYPNISKIHSNFNFTKYLLSNIKYTGTNMRKIDHQLYFSPAEVKVCCIGELRKTYTLLLYT